MILVSVLYPNDAGSKFDQDYYLRTHVPLVQARWGGMGLQDARVLRGTAAGDGGQAPYRVIALLTFGSMDEFRSAVKAHGAEIFADIPKFTDVKPVVQINEPLG